MFLKALIVFSFALANFAHAKEWTILNFMAADNDLETYAYRDLYEMEAGYSSGQVRAGSTATTDVIVELDTRGNEGIRRLHMMQRSDVYNGPLTNEKDIRSPVIQTLDEDKAPAQVGKRLKDFLLWGAKNYPSQKLAVIIWGHGQGWGVSSSTESKRNARNNKYGGIAFDDTQKSVLSILELKTILAEVVKSIGRKIDVLVFDSCLMQSIEVLTEVSASVRYIVGSTQSQNFLGLPYRRLLYEVNSRRYLGQNEKCGDDSACSLARMIPPLTKASWNPRLGSQGKVDPEGYKWFTMSAVNSDELRQILLPTTVDFSQSLLSFISADKSRSAELQLLLENRQKLPRFSKGPIDLGEFSGRILQWLAQENFVGPETEKLQKSIHNLRGALAKSIMSYSYGPNYQGVDNYLLGFFKVLSVWLPQSREDYMARRSSFAKSTFFNVGDAAWARFLAELYR